MSLRIAIFDDNKNIRDSIALLISTESEFEVVGSFGNVLNCIKNIEQCKPDIVLMDIEMPEMNGILAVSKIKNEFPQVVILMQTVFEDDELVFDAICAGASGYILKNFINTSLIESLHELKYGGSPMSPSIARKILFKMQLHSQETAVEPNNYALSSRELDVLTCLVNGLSYKMIGAELHISYETVRSHIKRIYEKLHVASVTEAVSKAMKEKIV